MTDPLAPFHGAVRSWFQSAFDEPTRAQVLEALKPLDVVVHDLKTMSLVRPAPAETPPAGARTGETAFVAARPIVHALLRAADEAKKATGTGLLEVEKFSVANGRCTVRLRVNRIEAIDVAIRENQDQREVLTEQAADLHARVEGHRDRRHGLHDEVTVSRSELTRLDEEVVRLEQAWNEAEREAAAAEEQVNSLAARMRHADDEIRSLEIERQDQQQQVTRAHVALAKVE